MKGQAKGRAKGQARGYLSRLAEPVAAGETALRVRRRPPGWDAAVSPPREAVDPRAAARTAAPTAARTAAPPAVRERELGDGMAAELPPLAEEPQVALRAGTRLQRSAVAAAGQTAKRAAGEALRIPETASGAADRRSARAGTPDRGGEQRRETPPAQVAAVRAASPRSEVRAEMVESGLEPAADEVRSLTERSVRAAGQRFEVVPAAPSPPLLQEQVQAESARPETAQPVIERPGVERPSAELRDLERPVLERLVMERRELPLRERVVSDQAEPASLGLPPNLPRERGGGTTVRIGTVEVRTVVRMPEAAPAAMPQPTVRMEPAAAASASGAAATSLSRGLGWRYGLVQG